jgi:hypothetical protein
MAVVATVTLTFILVGKINTLAPVVTMPFLLTYAAIDYSYFALAQTFDIQLRREERFRAQDFQSPTFDASPREGYGSVTHNHSEAADKFGSDLDKLFPERNHHKKNNVSLFFVIFYYYVFCIEFEVNAPQGLPYARFYNLVYGHVRFEVFTAVIMKNGIFWDVKPCGSCKNRRFGGT